MLIICDCSSFILSNIIIITSLVVNIICSKLLYISWMKFKLIYTELDNIYNTGIYIAMILEILAMAIQPYPSVHNEVYYEEANDFSAGIAF